MIAAARPYIRRYRGDAPSRWGLNLGAYTLHPSWVDWKREGNRLVFTLLPRGRAILDGQVRARIVGVGTFVPGRGWS